MSDATVTSIVLYIEAAREARQRAEHGRTVWAEQCEVILDLDAEGRILGIEILGADKVLRPETIALAEAGS